MKTCTKCLCTKPIIDFGATKGNKSGYLSACRICTSEWHKIYRILNSEKLKEKSKSDYNLNKDKHKAYSNLPHVVEKRKVKSKTPESREKSRLYMRDKRANNILFKLETSLRNRTNEAFKVKFWRKHGKTEEILGVSFEIAKAHLERQFKKGMTWENHGSGEGKWHIDHKIPLSSAKNEQQLRLLCHYKNLQPLWSIDNQRKYNIVVPTQISLPL